MYKKINFAVSLWANMQDVTYAHAKQTHAACVQMSPIC